MSWLAIAFATIVFYSLFDFFLKLSSDKIHSGLNAFVINLVAAILLFLFLLYTKFQGEKILEFKPLGLFYSIIAGIMGSHQFTLLDYLQLAQIFPLVYHLSVLA